jgi:hypothetical protein
MIRTSSPDLRAALRIRFAMARKNGFACQTVGVWFGGTTGEKDGDDKSGGTLRCTHDE